MCVCQIFSRVCLCLRMPIHHQNNPTTKRTHCHSGQAAFSPSLQHYHHCLAATKWTRQSADASTPQREANFSALKTLVLDGSARNHGMKSQAAKHFVQRIPSLMMLCFETMAPSSSKYVPIPHWHLRKLLKTRHPAAGQGEN